MRGAAWHGRPRRLAGVPHGTGRGSDGVCAVAPGLRPHPVPGLDQLRSRTRPSSTTGSFSKAGLDEVDLVGTGVGGWIAAQMAIMSQRATAPPGAGRCRPDSARREAEILDIFVTPWQEVIERGFHDAAPRARVSAHLRRGAHRRVRRRARGRPHDDHAHVLQTVHVRSGAAGHAGQGAACRRSSCGASRTRSCRSNARTCISGPFPARRCASLDECGHFAHLEQPDALAALLHEFVLRVILERTAMSIRLTQYYYFTEQPYTAYDPAIQDAVPVAAPDVAQLAVRSADRQRPVQPLPRGVSGRRRRPASTAS